MTENPKWLVAALGYVGQREVPGPGVSAWIRDMWLRLPGGRWFWDHYGRDDSRLPWCGAFMARVMLDCGLPHPVRYASALAWAEWGQPCGLRLGAVAVLRRAGGGHVGIVAGCTRSGRIVLVGGNQGNAVRLSAFDAGRVTAYRWPAGEREYPSGPLAVIDVADSTSEA